MNSLRNTMSKFAFAPQPATYDAQLPGLQMIPAADGTNAAVVHLAGPGRTLLYFHGNAEDLGNVSPILAHLNASGFNVLCFDYRGFGLSQGSPNENSIYSDTDAVLKAFGVDVPSLLVACRCQVLVCLVGRLVAGRSFPSARWDVRHAVAQEAPGVVDRG